MKITEIKIKLSQPSEDKLLAYASVTFDQAFVVRDIKIIQGNQGLFVAMPSRKMTDRCPACGTKNHLQARFCNHCGKKLADNRTGVDSRGRAKLHADIAHPINSKCRTELQNLILQKYKEELERSRQPGYQPSLRDDFDAGPEGDGPESLMPPPSSESAALAPQAGKDGPPPQDGKGFGIFA